MDTETSSFKHIHSHLSKHLLQKIDKKPPFPVFRPSGQPEGIYLYDTSVSPFPSSSLSHAYSSGSQTCVAMDFLVIDLILNF